MKTYQLKRAGEVKGTTQAENIDEALDAFFPTTLVDVDLESATPQRLDVRALHARRSVEAFVIEELTQ